MNLFKTAYDDTYYETVNEKRPFQQVEVRNKVNFIKHFRTSGRLLELGCGKGDLLAALADDFTVHGVDVSEYCVTETNQRFGRLVAEAVDLECTFPAGRYDVIVAFDVLEHLHDPMATMAAAFRSLNDGGVFLFTVPNNYGLVGSLATRYFNFIDRTHVSTWKRTAWVKALKDTAQHHESWNQIIYSFSANSLAKLLAFDYVGIAYKDAPVSPATPATLTPADRQRAVVTV